MSSHSFSVSLRHLLRNSGGVADPGAEKDTPIASDDELMVLIKHGDHEAFEQLFARYYIAVRSVARKILRNREDVADVVQETFLDAYQHSATFDESKGTLKSWISCLAYHRSLKRIRVLKRGAWQSGDSDELPFVLDSKATPDRWIRSLDFRKVLNAVLCSLDERQRQTMLLYFFEGLDLNVIAVHLGETLGNTRNHLYRGLAKLRGELMQSGLLKGYTEFDKDENRER
jgi:RNA polymerase sigma-70 factor, ECF subfamily